jgi:acetyl-CoA C-acetyltransferase
MRGVSVIGIGSTPYGVLEGKPLKELATLACNEAIRNAQIDRKEIQAFYLGNFVSGILLSQETIAPLVGNCLQLSKEVPCTKVEGACCSAGIAFRQGFILIASGFADIVLVAGVEKMTSAPIDRNTTAISSGMDWEEEGKAGLTFPGLFGLVAHRYMHDFGVSIETIGKVSVKNRANGAKNPRARFRKEVTLEEVMRSRPISDPLKLYDCCSIADGASAAVLCRADWADKFTDQPVDIVGSGQALGYSTLYAAPDLTTISVTVRAAQQAYQMANLKPADIDFVELHDCFTIAELVDSEDLGFFEKGKGGRALEDGITQVDGRLPINPSGGLLAKGHPVGATGIGQIVEIVKQLRGEHENQVKDAQIGLAHNVGATGSVGTVHILKRR